MRMPFFKGYESTIKKMKDRKKTERHKNVVASGASFGVTIIKVLSGTTVVIIISSKNSYAEMLQKKNIVTSDAQVAFCHSC